MVYQINIKFTIKVPHIYSSGLSDSSSVPFFYYMISSKNRRNTSTAFNGSGPCHFSSDLYSNWSLHKSKGKPEASHLSPVIYKFITIQWNEHSSATKTCLRSPTKWCKCIMQSTAEELKGLFVTKGPRF